MTKEKIKDLIKIIMVNNKNYKNLDRVYPRKKIKIVVECSDFINKAIINLYLTNYIKYTSNLKIFNLVYYY
jgi:uncharacterized protein YqiB (DUF1249 family)